MASPNALAIVCIAAVLWTCLFIWTLIQTRLLSPLRKIPGPFLASITDYWLIFTDLGGLRTTRIHELHQKYGPVVRIGPNEVSFADEKVIKEIYGQNTAYLKAPWYDTVSLKPLGIFSMRNKADHSKRRSLLSHAFSQANLNNTAPLVRNLVIQLREVIERHQGQAVNVFAKFRYFALDVVGELFLGASFGALEAEDPPTFLDDVDRHFLTSAMEATSPLLFRVISMTPVPSLQYFLGARERVADYGHEAYKTYIKNYGRDSGRKDLLTKILNPKADEAPMTEKETTVEIGNLVFAGTDTTSTTLTYLFWELTRNTEWQAKIRDELVNTNFSIESTQPTMQSLLDAPILDAVITEALRLHPAAPASLPRVTPKGGAVLSSYEIPENTIVSMQCYTTQRDASVFEHPDTFRPGRWMNEAAATPSMKEMFMPFSKGSRACLGKNLAMMELKLVTATLLQRFEVSAPPETTAYSMAMRDHFLVLPKSGRCDLVFTPMD